MSSVTNYEVDIKVQLRYKSFSEVIQVLVDTKTEELPSVSFDASYGFFKIELDNSRNYKKSLYVDVILTGTETKGDILWIHREITTTFPAAGFELRKFQTNAHDLLHKFEGSTENVSNSIKLSENKASKKFRISWDYNLNKLNSVGSFDSNTIIKNNNWLTFSKYF